MYIFAVGTQHCVRLFHCATFESFFLRFYFILCSLQLVRAGVITALVLYWGRDESVRLENRYNNTYKSARNNAKPNCFAPFFVLRKLFSFIFFLQSLTNSLLLDNFSPCFISSVWRVYSLQHVAVALVFIFNNFNVTALYTLKFERDTNQWYCAKLIENFKLYVNSKDNKNNFLFLLFQVRSFFFNLTCTIS